MANEVAPWEEANNLEPFDVVVPKGVEPTTMAKDIYAGKIPVKQPSIEGTPWAEESAPWEEDKLEVSTAGVRILPSMPEKRPAVIPKPKEQMKVHSMVDSLPKELSVEVKKEAIQKQREKQYGVIKSAPAFTLANAIENIPQNMEDIVAETGSLIMNIGRLAKNALVDHDELNKQLEPAVKLTGAVIKDWQSMFKGATPKEIEKLPIGQALNQQFEKIERQGIWTTLGQFAEKRPIDAILIGQAAKTAVSGGVRVTAKGFSKVVPKGTAIGDKIDNFLSTERTPVVFEMPVEVDGATTPAKTIEFPREYSTDPLTKYIYEKSFDKVLETFPKAKTALADHKANQLIDKIRRTYEQGNFIERQKLIDESMGMINTLSKEEQAIIVPYLEGRASLIGDTSEQFQKFETWYRDLSGKITGELSKAGKLAPEQIRARLYQPIEKATGMTVDEIVAEFGDFTPAYVHHSFPERFGQKMGDFFADTTGKRYTPSFLKRSQGVAGYTEDLKEILPKWTAQYVKFKNTEAFINDLTGKFGIPVNIKKVKQVAGGIQVGDKVYKGYKIVAPDGFLNFYRGNVDFYKEVSKRLEAMDFDESIADAILTSFEGQGKQFMGVSKNRRVFLVPDNVAKRLESYATPLFGSQKAQTAIKLAYDKPTQFWKDMTLAAAPRWIKNNVLGDVFFNTMEGVGPLSYGRSFTSKYRDIIPDELIRASFANTMKYNPKLGTAAQNTIGRLAQIIGETIPIKVASKAKDLGYGLNTIFETPFVRGLYVKLAREQAVRLLNSQKIKVTEESIMAKLAEFKSNPALREPLINKIQSTLPVFDLTGNLERKYLKRLMPFYNWYKFMAVYAAKLPINHPFKTVGLRGLGELSEQQREQAFMEMFPYMKREIEESGVPDRFDNMWPIKMEEDGKALFFNTRGMNVFTTVEDIMRGDVLNMLSPLVKIPIERSSGRETFTNREYKTGDAGADYQGKEKQVPPLGEHILNQFQQYKLLKQSLVPAQQYDSGTLMNPEPILDKITGEYKYPIESVEKWFNYIGIDTRTTDVRKVFDSYKQQKAAAIGETFNKQQSKADTALTLNDIKGILHDLKSDKVRWNQIIKDIQANEKQKGVEQKKLSSKLKNKETP